MQVGDRYRSKAQGFLVEVKTLPDHEFVVFFDTEHPDTTYTWLRNFFLKRFDLVEPTKPAAKVENPYPRTCPFCGCKAYVGFNVTVDCSNSYCYSKARHAK